MEALTGAAFGSVIGFVHSLLLGADEERVFKETIRYSLIGGCIGMVIGNVSASDLTPRFNCVSPGVVQCPTCETYLRH